MFDVYVAFHAQMRPRAVAVITPRRRVTYAQFNADVNRYAAAFMEMGITPATGVVALESRQPYRHVVMLMALARLGVAAGTASDTLCELKLSDQAGTATDRVRRMTADWLAAVEARPPVEVPSAPRDLDGLGRVLLSSGTTGTPRRVPSTWRQRLDRGASNMATDIRGKLGVWALLPGVNSGQGYNLSVLGFTLGVTIALGFGAAELLEVMERNPEGILGLTPNQLQGLLQAMPPGFEPKPGWRAIMSGAALPPALARAARTRLTPDILISYGATEFGRAALAPASLLETVPGAVGWPAPGVRIEVVDPDGKPVPDGEQGEIRIRSHKMGASYLDNTEASASTFRDGFVYPGDLGRRLPNGCFVVDGRIDDRMNIGGIKVMPNLLENALLEHPQVQDAAAFTVPNARGVEECWIAVVADGEIDRDTLMACLRTARVQLPQIHFARTPEIPRNARSKIDRQALRTQTQAALGKGKGAGGSGEIV